MLPLGPLQHGPAAAHLLVGHGQLADDLLLLGPQPRRLQGHRGLPGQQLDQLQLGPAELPRGNRVGDDDPGQGAGSAQRRDQQGPVALGRRQVPQPAVGAGLAHVGDDDRAALPVGAGGRGVEVGTWRPDTQPLAVADLGQVVGGETAPAGDLEALPPLIGQHHRAELEPDQLAGLLGHPGQHARERLGGVDRADDLADGGHPRPQRGRHLRHAHIASS